MKRLVTPILLLPLAIGCASPLAGPGSPDAALARQDHASLSAFHHPVPDEEPDGALTVAGYGYQSWKFTVAQSLSAAVNAPLGALDDLAVAAFAPFMGSPLQDAIDDTTVDLYRKGASFGRFWRSIPPVSPRGKDLHLRDPDEAIPPPLRLEPSAVGGAPGG